MTTAPTWGLQCDITPRLGARLVQEGTHLHFLSDRANIVGTLSLEATQALDAAFPALITKLESQLLSGALDPRCQQCLTVRHGDLSAMRIRWAVTVMSISRCIRNCLEQQTRASETSPFPGTNNNSWRFTFMEFLRCLLHSAQLSTSRRF